MVLDFRGLKNEPVFLSHDPALGAISNSGEQTNPAGQSPVEGQSGSHSRSPMCLRASHRPCQRHSQPKACLEVLLVGRKHRVGVAGRQMRGSFVGSASGSTRCHFPNKFCQLTSRPGNQVKNKRASPCLPIPHLSCRSLSDGVSLGYPWAPPGNQGQSWPSWSTQSGNARETGRSQGTGPGHCLHFCASEESTQGRPLCIGCGNPSWGCM